MNIYSTYSVKIKHYNHIFEKTAEKYQAAVDFYMDVCLKEWSQILEIPGAKARQMYVEQITHRTKYLGLADSKFKEIGCRLHSASLCRKKGMCTHAAETWKRMVSGFCV